MSAFHAKERIHFFISKKTANFLKHANHDPNGVLASPARPACPIVLPLGSSDAHSEASTPNSAPRRILIMMLFSSTMTCSTLRPFHPRSGPPRSIGIGGRSPARAGLVHSLRGLCARGRYGSRLFPGALAERFFPTTQRRGVGDRLLLRLSLFMDRRRRRLEPRSIARTDARIRPIAEAGLITAAASPEKQPLDHLAEPLLGLEGRAEDFSAIWRR